MGKRSHQRGMRPLQMTTRPGVTSEDVLEERDAEWRGRREHDSDDDL